MKYIQYSGRKICKLKDGILAHQMYLTFFKKKDYDLNT